MRRLPEEEYEYTEMVQQRLPSPPPTRVPLVHKLQTLIPGMLWYTERTYERIFRDPRDDDGQPVHSQAQGNIEIVRLVFAGILAGAGHGMHRKNPEDALLIPVTILGSIVAYVMWTAVQASML